MIEYENKEKKTIDVDDRIVYSWLIIVHCLLLCLLSRGLTLALLLFLGDR